MSNDNAAITLGVIGAGRIAQVAHLPAVLKASNVRLVAISDPSEQVVSAVARRYGVPGDTSTADLLARDLDAVLIAAPDRFHLPLGLQAIAAGKHVLMEKPLAATSAEARELVAAASARGVRLQTGSMKRHDPAIEFARANIGRIGRILSMSSWYRVMAASRPAIQQTLFPPLVIDETVRAVESGFKADGERYRLMTHGAHLFDTVRYLAGDLDWLTTVSAAVAGDLTWHGTAKIATGGLASFEITTSVHDEWSEGNDIYGEFGHIKTRSPYTFTKLGSSVELYVEAEGVSVVPHFADTNPYKRQLEAFARSVLTGAPTNPSPEDGVHAVRLIEAAATSAASDGARVDLR